MGRANGLTYLKLGNAQVFAEKNELKKSLQISGYYHDLENNKYFFNIAWVLLKDSVANLNN